MMQRLEERGAILVDALTRNRVGAIALKLRNELIGVRIETGAGQVVIAGRNLLRRWLTDPALRFVGSLGR